MRLRGDDAMALAAMNSLPNGGSSDGGCRPQLSSGG
jgi:hypothetical protein